MSKNCDGRERQPGGFAYTSPYFQYGRLGGVKETFAWNYILFGVSGLRGIEVLRGLDNFCD
jgi:hypothetical protein